MLMLKHVLLNDAFSICRKIILNITTRLTDYVNTGLLKSPGALMQRVITRKQFWSSSMTSYISIEFN